MNNKTITVAVLGAIIIGIVVIFFKGDDDTLSPSEQSYAVTDVTKATRTGTSTAATTTKTGTYTATVDYRVPAPELNKITITLTLDSDIIKAVTANNEVNSPASKQYSEGFLGNYEAAVVGKKLSDIALSRVGGASLTSNAFNAAVKAIVNQAS